jgi:FkbM family methyltransferase
MLKKLVKKAFNNGKTKSKLPVQEIGVVPKAEIYKFLPENPIIIDAGAHVGLDTVEMSRMWPGSAVHAFEPIPEVFDQLLKNTQGFKNVRCYPLALSDSNSSQQIYVSSGESDASSSLYPPKEHLSVHPNVKFLESIQVPTLTIDAWASKHNIDHVDLLWLDMQGGELAALKASPKILKTVRAIHTEVLLQELYESCPLYPEVRDWLMSQGFKVEREELVWQDAGNVLFVKED